MSSANNKVTHPGIVKKVDGNKVEVSVIAQSGCASCQLKGVCSVGEVQEKVVEVEMSGFSFKEGQTVTIEMSQSLGTMAVLLGYVFPFVVLLSGLIIFLQLGLDQGIAGILSLLLLIPYYGTLYLSRKYFRKKFKYSVY